jgi:hypothetical protein
MAVLAVSAAAPPAPAQSQTAGRVVVSAKVDSRVLDRAQSEPVMPVFIVLEHQPQREIFAQAEGLNALYRQVAESRYRRAAERASPDAEELRQARKAVDEVVLRTRQQAFQAIAQAIGAEQQTLRVGCAGSGRLASGVTWESTC